MPILGHFGFIYVVNMKLNDIGTIIDTPFRLYRNEKVIFNNNMCVRRFHSRSPI
jgi:hypothetical protein